MAENFFFRTPTEAKKFVAEHKAQYKATSRVVKLYINSGGQRIFPMDSNPRGGQSALTSTNTVMLKGAQISLDGDYGTLRRAKVELIFPNHASFEHYEVYLGIGKELHITYGYQDGSMSEILKFRIYNPTFKLLANGTVEMTVQAVGTGNELLESNALETTKIVELNLSYVADYAGIFPNVTQPVTTIVDYIDHCVQQATQTLSSTLFQPDEGGRGPGEVFVDAGKYPKAGFVIKSIDDDVYKNKNIAYQDTMWTDEYKLVYVSLGWIIALFNRFIQPAPNGLVTSFELVCNGSEEAKVKLDYPNIGNLPSADPLTILLTYGQGDLTADYATYTTKYVGKAATAVQEADGTPFEISKVPNMSTFNLRDGDPNGILINRDAIKSIYYETNPNADTKEDKRNASKVSIDTFFQKLFKLIKENTGGAIDLYLTTDPENKDVTKARILVVNGKQPAENAVTPLSFDIGDYATKEISLESSVPKDLQATIFGAAPGSAESGTTTGQILSDNSIQTAILPTVDDISVAKARCGQANFDPESITALRDLIKRVVVDQPPAEKAKFGTELLPLSLKLKLHGTDGFKFGDTLTTNLLPKKYRTEKNGARVAFTLLRYTHTFSGTGQILWETEVETACRLIEANKYSG
jgi:hypothetical protein